MSLKEEVKKLVLISTTFTPIVITREKAVKTVKIARASKDNKESEGGKYPRNFI